MQLAARIASLEFMFRLARYLVKHQSLHSMLSVSPPCFGTSASLDVPLIQSIASASHHSVTRNVVKLFGEHEGEVLRCVLKCELIC